MDVKKRVQEALIDFYDHDKPAAIILSEGQWRKFRSLCSTQDDLLFDNKAERFTYAGHPIWLSRHVNGPAVIGAVVLEALRAIKLRRGMPLGVSDASYIGEMIYPLPEDPILY